jgi:hypothetical protein
MIERAPEQEGTSKEGLAMTIDQAIAFALRRPSP